MTLQANSSNPVEDLDEPHRSITLHIRQKLDGDDIAKYVRWCKRDGEHYATKTETVAKKVAQDVAEELDVDFEFDKSPHSGYHKGCAHIETAVSLRLEEDDRVEYVNYGSKGDWKWIPDDLADKREEAREEARAKFQRAMTSLHEGDEGLEEMGATVDIDGEFYSGSSDHDRMVSVLFDDTGRGYHLSVSISDDASEVYVSYKKLRKRDGKWKWMHSTDAFTQKPAPEHLAAAIVEMEKHHERMERLSG